MEILGMTKAAIWARVSTGDQQTENQLFALRQWAQSRGFEVVKEYAVEESAFNGKHRVQLEQARQDACARSFDVLLVWALDRLSREGIEPTLKAFRQFHECGVRILSKQESWTEGPPEMQELLISIFAWVARMESKRRSERIKAALAKRRAAGLPVGRQKGAKDKKGRPRKRSGYFARWERNRSTS